MVLWAIPLVLLKGEYYMSMISASLLFIVFLIIIIFQVLKMIQIGSLNTAMRKKDYDTVDKIASMSMVQKIIGQYTCDSYQIKAYYLSKNVDLFESKMHQMIKTEYKNQDDKKTFLEYYFHAFLLKKNIEYARILLDGIFELGDEKFHLYNQQAFEVIINEKNDLIEEMEQEIEGKYYYGFPLGVICYMIALQFERINNLEMAIVYYHNAKVCFTKNAVYSKVLDNKLMQLDPEGLKEY